MLLGARRKAGNCFVCPVKTLDDQQHSRSADQTDRSTGDVADVDLCTFEPKKGVSILMTAVSGGKGRPDGW